ncbi:GMC family oxidoreductase N-terminal domain-containing protein [Podospora australis]|uniref:GMC family oxidoreductase N-terminal domain-containing protein n=1 Tax=Podospora australis TaxID=1536484 RepID=A0AAN6WL09_9PEZI|nr:GMC family oxidoreductase N-terminal domain-containing protein [Podospora australis]
MVPVSASAKMVFSTSTYDNFVSEKTSSQTRLFAPYGGHRDDFDVIIVGSGFGGGILADDLAEKIGQQKRILMLEAGSYLYPTHIYNVCRFPNSSVAKNFACRTFSQDGNETSENYIHERPQLNFGGRSIWWSGLIPQIQPWELDFFPDKVRRDLEGGLLENAGTMMNESHSMGTVAEQIVQRFNQSSLAQDFVIRQTPRAVHQPYLQTSGAPRDTFFTEPTGVFNTAELLINQVGLAPGVSHGDGPGLHLLLNKFVESIDNNIPNSDLKYRVNTTDTLTSQPRSFRAKTVILAGGSIESPKLLRRSSSVMNSLSPAVKSLVGVGLTDHPTTSELSSFVSHMGDLYIPRHAHAKIILYSKGLRGPNGEIKYPFNVEINVNHEYWHLRENDPSEPSHAELSGPSRIDFKFSFGNPVYGGNRMDGDQYVPRMEFKNLSWASHLAGSRFPALAGWQKSIDEIWAVLNDISFRVMSEFKLNGRDARPEGEAWFGKNGKGFGMATVHHAACSLRMPFRWTYNGQWETESVVDEDLQVRGMEGLYVCDMSVMPFSSAANPVRTLAALGLRLSERVAERV